MYTPGISYTTNRKLRDLSDRKSLQLGSQDLLIGGGGAIQKKIGRPFVADVFNPGSMCRSSPKLT